MTNLFSFPHWKTKYWLDELKEPNSEEKRSKIVLWPGFTITFENPANKPALWKF